MKGKALEYLLSRPLLCTVEAAEAAASVALRLADGKPEAVESKRGKTMDGEAGMTTRNGVATIPVCGPIFRYSDYFTDLCGGATVEAMTLDLERAVTDSGVHTILLNIDSPGGEAAGIGELAAAIRLASKSKPVCAYIDNEGCSAAYWLASAASEIVVAEQSMVGSIGVVCGYTVRGPRSGETKYEFVSSQSPDKRPDLKTEAGKAVVQQTMDALCSVFIGNVAKYRSVTPEHVMEHFGKGGVKVGADAVASGMADAVGDYESTLARLARGESLPRKPVPVPPKPGKQATASTLKGVSMFNPFSVIASLFKADPEAVNKAIAESGDDDGMSGFLAKLSVPPPTNPPTAAVDEAAIRAKADADATAKADTDKRAALTEFFGRQAAAFLAPHVKAGRIDPANVPLLTARYVNAAVDDHFAPLFYVGVDNVRKETTRLSLVVESIEAKPAKARTEEKIPADATDLPASLAGLRILATAASTPEEAAQVEKAKQLAAMLNATPEGRNALAELSKAGK